tara:strand:- start:113 stop:730 length:618 start_codon:yes stop_codon:yes gene_type:complete
MASKYNLEGLNVSRETKKILNEYVCTLVKWNKSINLVSSDSISNIWERHIVDSAQLTSYLSFDKKIWVDLGSGAGFPGLVIAIIALEKSPNLKMVLIESDRRKCVFLGEVARKLNLNVEVICNRIEDCSSLNADIISARALAPMKKLLWYFNLLSRIKTKGVFLKGKNIKLELNAVEDLGKFEIKISRSIGDNSGVVVEVNKRKF